MGAMEPILTPLNAASDHRQLIATKSGTVGLGLRKCASGDEVWILPGARVFIVLRSTDRGTHTLVGDAYIHGFMDGEAFTSGMLSSKDRETVIVE